MTVGSGRASTSPSRTKSSTPRAVRLLALVGTLATLLTAFFVGVRPRYLRWGATDAELRMPLPGDGIIPDAARQETRAITIRAPMDRVWPWLAQVGQDRGGFYSFDLLENLVGCEMPTADVLRPDRQAWRIGDKLWMYPPHRADGVGFATLRSYVPGRALGFATHAVGSSSNAGDGSWTYVLQPLGDGRTRLLIRGRGARGRSLLGVAFDRAVFEPVHFVMERRMMIGIKQLVEQGDRHRAANHVHVLLWMATFALFVAAAVLVLRRDEWLRPLTAFVATGVVFEVLTLGQPPIAVGLLLVAAASALLWPVRRPPPRRAGSREESRWIPASSVEPKTA
jgi:hypothetical protein